MSYFKELTQSEIDALSRKDMDEYYNKRELNHIRDKFAMAALTGLIGNKGRTAFIDDTVKDAFKMADKMMVERVK